MSHTSVWQETSLADKVLDPPSILLQCPNGHFYIIGDCGGAMQESRCPECGAAIGGMSHRLVSSNRPSARLQELARRR